VPTDIDGIDLRAEKVDRQQLIDLLKHMLLLDQDRRIKPDEALNHPFQTLTHVAEYAHCTT
jgi:homeodomain interacting protein kinase